MRVEPTKFPMSEEEFYAIAEVIISLLDESQD